MGATSYFGGKGRGEGESIPSAGFSRAFPTLRGKQKKFTESRGEPEEARWAGKNVPRSCWVPSDAGQDVKSTGGEGGPRIALTPVLFLPHTAQAIAIDWLRNNIILKRIFCTRLL